MVDVNYLSIPMNQVALDVFIFFFNFLLKNCINSHMMTFKKKENHIEINHRPVWPVCLLITSFEAI
jgi:hypothetical protein